MVVSGGWGGRLTVHPTPAWAPAAHRNLGPADLHVVAAVLTTFPAFAAALVELRVGRPPPPPLRARPPCGPRRRAAMRRPGLRDVRQAGNFCFGTRRGQYAGGGAFQQVHDKVPPARGVRLS
jgi:hypothetical protein